MEFAVFFVELIYKQIGIFRLLNTKSNKVDEKIGEDLSGMGFFLLRERVGTREWGNLTSPTCFFF